MPMNRRTFLKRGAGAVVLGTTVPLIHGCPTRGNEIRTIRSRRSLDGLLDTSLTVKRARTTIGGETLYSRTYEGTIPGPTLEVFAGDTIRLRIANDLPVEHKLLADKGMDHGGFNTT